MFALHRLAAVSVPASTAQLSSASGAMRVKYFQKATKSRRTSPGGLESITAKTQTRHVWRLHAAMRKMILSTCAEARCGHNWTVKRRWIGLDPARRPIFCRELSTVQHQIFSAARVGVDVDHAVTTLERCENDPNRANSLLLLFNSISEYPAY
ncbi:hypothetical protein BC830DRAFT_1094836 [Chytriomyces sp. MP71]|nr:hypothetical protein BC830DRAFT_1094836 [Chytriomyces sp. MP71]